MPLYLIESQPVLFIHVPKAGGTTIEFALDQHRIGLLDRNFAPRFFPCSPQHFHAEMLTGLIDPSALSYVFMTVRHPIARLKSEYAWRRHFFDLEQDFETWAFSCLSRLDGNPFLGDNHFRPMVDFKSEGAEWFRLEDGLEKVFARLNDLFPTLALARSPDRLMSSQRVGDMPVSSELRARVEEIYALDFTTFGY